MRGRQRARERRTRSAKSDEDDPDGETPETGGTTEATEPTTETVELTWDQWYEDQPDEVRALIDGHTKGLRSALQTERADRKALEKQLREAASRLEKGSEEREALEAQADQLNELQRQADFYDAAHTAGVLNLRLAWLAANADGLVDERTGAVDMGKLKAAHPQLFAPTITKPATGNAGTGTNSSPAPAGGMNEFIRTAAGRH